MKLGTFYDGFNSRDEVKAKSRYNWKWTRMEVQYLWLLCICYYVLFCLSLHPKIPPAGPFLTPSHSHQNIFKALVTPLRFLFYYFFHFNHFKSIIFQKMYLLSPLGTEKCSNSSSHSYLSPSKWFFRLEKGENTPKRCQKSEFYFGQELFLCFCC